MHLMRLVEHGGLVILNTFREHELRYVLRVVTRIRGEEARSITFRAPGC